MNPILRAVVLFVLFGALVSTSWGYLIVRKDGSTFEAEGPPEYKDGQAIVVLKGGSKGAMPESSIDKERTEAANRSETPEEAEPAKGVVTNESLGSVAPGGKTKSTFTNDDLADAKGLSTVEGDISTGQDPAESSESEEDWARRHDEEMARLEEERRIARGESPPPSATPAEGEEPPKELTQEEKIQQLEQKVQELREKLFRIDQFIGGGGGDNNTVTERNQTAAELNQAQEELRQAQQ